MALIALYSIPPLATIQIKVLVENDTDAKNRRLSCVRVFMVDCEALRSP